MKFINFKIKFQNNLIIDIGNVENYFGKIDRRRLYEWQQKKYIIKITNNYYIFSDQEITDALLRMLANRIYAPSYIGLESALSYYGFIPEAVFQIKSITTRRAKTFKTPIAQFSYNSINKNLFCGYNIIKNQSYQFFISTPEKAILDYLYYNPQIKDILDFKELRLNKEEIKKIINLTALKQYLSIFNNTNLGKTTKKLMGFINVKF